MTRNTKLTSKMLGVLAVVFVIIIIILCVVPKERDHTYDQYPKSRGREGIVPTTTTAATTTTPPPPPPETTTEEETDTTTTTTTTTTIPPPPPPPETTTEEETDTTTTITTTTTTTTTAPETTDIIEETTTYNNETDNTTSAITTTTTITNETDDYTNITTKETPPTTQAINTTEGMEDDNTTSAITTTTTITNETDDYTNITTTETPPTTQAINTTEGMEDDNTTTTTTISTTTPTLPHHHRSIGNKCVSPACRSQATDMLVMMDNTGNVEPCEDFYQYACGGVMNKPYIKPRQPGTMARMMIKEELEKQESNILTGPGKMKAFYDSCLSPNSQDARKDWAKPIRDTFGTYDFQTNESFTFDLSEALGFMMNRGFTPFFSIDLEVGRDDTNSFMLSLHPTKPGSPFTDDLARKVCLEEHHAYLLSLGNNSYKVTEEYDKFTNCVRTGSGLEARLVRMKDAVVRLQLIKDEQLLNTTLENTKRFLTQLSPMQPDVPKLTLDLANENYDNKKYADSIEGQIDWIKVLKQFPYIDDSNARTLQILMYEEDTFSSIIDLLHEYHSISQLELNNILLLLWVESVYTNFIEPVGSNVGDPDYCLNTAIALMEDTASYLYLQAVAPDVSDRDTQIDEIAENIKWEGMRMIKNNSTILKEYKLKDMMSNLVKLNKINEAESTQSMEDVSLTADFLHNSLQLLTNRMKLMMKSLDGVPTNNYKVFARPYSPNGFYSYILNKTMVPYAIQEPFQTLKQLPEYLQYATVGHQISHLMWHGYDTSGKYSIPSLTGEELSNLQNIYTGHKSYINHEGSTAYYEVTNLTLNEIWADTKAIDMTWQAYINRNDVRPTQGKGNLILGTSSSHRRRRSTTEDLKTSQELGLPLLDMSPVQLYYLQWAQQYCSDSSDLRMLEVMESRQPPGRQRVNFVTQYSNGFREAFNCATPPN